MKNRIINIGVIEDVAAALKDFKEQVVFIGGAVVSLYADDLAADEIRPTADIDMVINLTGDADLTLVEEQLVSLDFSPDPDSNSNSIRSYHYNNIPLNIIYAEDGSLDTANKWYKIGFEDLRIVKAIDEQINILKAPCYLATKFEAFNNRGQGNYRASHDFEDIIFVLDNRINIINEIDESDDRIKAFLISEISKVLLSKSFEEILSAHLHPLIAEDRYPLLLEKFNRIKGLWGL